MWLLANTNDVNKCDDILKTYLLACELKNTKLSVLGLMGMENLIAHDATTWISTWFQYCSMNALSQPWPWVRDKMWSVKAHEAKSVFSCETHFHKWGKMQRIKPNDSQMHSRFGSCKELRMFKALVGMAKNTKLVPPGYY